MNAAGKGRGSGSQKSNYHRNEMQNMLEVDISEMECNSQGQNNNKSHYSAQMHNIKPNSNGQLSGQKGTDTRTNTTEGFSNTADKQTYNHYSDIREIEDPDIRRMSE